MRGHVSTKPTSIAAILVSGMFLGMLFIPINTAHAVIILPENVDWSHNGYVDSLPVQEPEPPEPSPPREAPREPLVTIRLHPFQSHLGEDVRLVDVAEITAEDPDLAREVASIELFPAPQPGKRLYVYPRRVEAALRHLGLASGDFEIDGPDRVRVETPGQKVSVEEIEETINDALQNRTGAGNSGEVEAFLIRPPVIPHLPQGDLRIEVEDLDRPGSGIRNVQLAFWVDGVKVDTRTVAVRVNQKTYGVVAARDMDAGEVVREEDLEEGLIPVRSARAGSPVDHPDEIVGATLKRGIRAGDPIYPKDVEWTPILKQGAHVTLVQSVGSVRLTAPGILAENLHRIGQVVQVRKLNSRKKIFGKAVSPRVIQVE